VTGLLSEFTTTDTGATAAASADRLEYRVSEQTGTPVLHMNSSGLVVENNRVLPYGDPWLTFTGSANDNYFTNYIRDPDAQLDYALTRHYTGWYGRFMSPDMSRAGQDPMSPQTWNLYAYAINDPIDLNDPSGRNYEICVTGGECFEVQDDEYESYVSQFLTYGYNLPTHVGRFVETAYQGKLDEYCVTVRYINRAARGANNTSADPTLDNRATALAQEISKTGVRAMANPCTYAAWTAVAGTAGAAGVVGANAGEIYVAVSDNAPTIYSRILNWWFNLTSRPGKPGLVRAAAAAAVKTKDAVVTTCNRFEGQ
jgi:RHS repeat-associated protein